MSGSLHAFTRRRLLGVSIVSVASVAGIAGVARSSAHDDHEHGDSATPSASPQASPAASPEASATTFTISTVDLAFKPKALSIPANTDVELVVTNEGKLPHDFVIGQLGISSGGLNAGDSVTIPLNAAPGTYQFQCSVPGHKQAGMFGTLTAE